MKIMCDVDGVLLDFNTSFRQWLKKEFPTIKFDLSDWHLGMPPDQAQKIVDAFFEVDEEISNLLPFPGAKTGLSVLKNTGHEVHIVTALPAKYKVQREKNLEGWEYDSLSVIGHDKMDYIVNELNPDVGIEDKPENIKIMDDAGITVFYPDISLTKYVNVGHSYKSWYYLTRQILGLPHFKE